MGEQVQQTMANITEGVCPPLRVRVEQILSTDMEATLLYSITNLLRFYQKVIGEVSLQHMIVRSFLPSLNCYYNFPMWKNIVSNIVLIIYMIIDL